MQGVGEPPDERGLAGAGADGVAQVTLAGVQVGRGDGAAGEERSMITPQRIGVVAVVVSRRQRRNDGDEGTLEIAGVETAASLAAGRIDGVGCRRFWPGRHNDRGRRLESGGPFT
jgi:hypothetical protein